MMVNPGSAEVGNNSKDSVMCLRCNGTGLSSAHVKCNDCRGFGFISPRTTECQYCGGTGFIKSHVTCDHCSGFGNLPLK
jgi:DnaJ-class molecular chaperone